MKPEKITELDWKLLKEKYPNNLEEIIKKINNNYPVQYLIGTVDFYKTTLKVNENVLIPRFETEYLVEKLIKILKEMPKNTLKIIDIGTGSGCIAINLALELSQDITAIDISPTALEVAKENAHKYHTKITFKELDILKEESLENYDIIISNPPYVDYREYTSPETKFEPQNALYAKNNGLEFYEHIIKIIKNKPKLIAFEIGCKQGDYIKTIILTKFPDYQVTIERDLANRDRFVFAKPTK